MSDKKPSPEVVGRQFIKKYYERLHNQPETMHRFYQDKSSLIYGEGSNNVDEITTGLEAIKLKLSERCSRDWVLSLENGSVDAQQSMEGGVLLMVTGTITSKANRQPRQFVQSFFLAEHVSKHSSAYYVLNDTFRVIDRSPVVSASTADSKSHSEKTPVKSKKTIEVSPLPVGTAPNKESKNGVDESAEPPEVLHAIEEPAPVPRLDSVATAPVPEQATSENKKEKKPFSWANLVKTDTTAPSRQEQDSQQQQPKQQKHRGNKHRGSASTQTAVQTKSGASSNNEPTLPAEKSPRSGETELERKSRKLKATLSPEEMPSTAIFVKNLEISILEDELKCVFLPFMTEPDMERLLVAEHFDRGFAFIDLGSQEAVARAVSASRSPEGIKVGNKVGTKGSNKTKSENKRLVVEPSQKPVRPSGLKAIHERRGSNTSSNGSTPTVSPKLTYNKGKGGGGGGGGVGGANKERGSGKGENTK